MRLCQEIVLGVGGVRALRALDITPAVWHMNEGHVAFLGLERARERVLQGEGLGDALAAVAQNAVFTTHTPVPAGQRDASTWAWCSATWGRGSRRSAATRRPRCAWARTTASST